VLALLAAAQTAARSAAPLIPDLNARLHPSDSTPWTIVFVLTLITLLPAILMAMTPMVRLMVVFHFLRQALGTQTAPSNPTLLGLGLMMTWFLMTPVMTQVDQQAVEPYRSGQITGMEAIDKGAEPVKHFMLRYAREKDLALFTAAGQIPRPNTADDLPMRVVVPAYILSELKAGFAIGGETVDPSTDLTITGPTGSGGTATITAPVLAAGEPLGSAGPPPTGYIGALDAALAAQEIIGVNIGSNNGVLTISGATSTSGNVVADAAAANATGTLQFNAAGTLVSPAADIGGIEFSGLSDGAAPLSLTWDLYGANGAADITQSANASAETAQSQNGYITGDSPEQFFSNFVSTLGSTVSQVQTENTAQNASVSQLQTQNNALSEVNLNDEASAMTTLERSYQAASQVFSMLNTIMASALNLGEQTTVS
jgi:flagellar biosynthesis protein FliP